ncbi:MAG TPA: beta-mannosidase [Bacteroidales bacterium]|mgnify:FL=1|nr:beta-mannosidase [Bacteroidales bacterium]
MKGKVFAGLLLMIALAGCGSSQKYDYVTVDDGIFRLAGEPYYFIGANYWYGAILGTEGQYGDRGRLLRELDHMKSIGITNLRIMVGPEGPDNEPFRVTPALQAAPGEYSGEMLDGLDFLLAEMGKRGMHAILFLNNAWDWSGGFSQYLSWNGYGPIPNPNVPPNTWPQFMAFSGQFNTCEPCIRQFEEFIRFILGRTNTCTGVKYTDDPAIMTWEIANEPRAFSDENIPAFGEMIARIAALLQELDENHLVTTGTEGRHGCEQKMELFESIHADPNIDYLVMHIWPKNWGWLDIADIAGTLDSSVVKTNRYIDDHLEVAVRLHKPIVLEEFGLPRDLHGFSPDESTVARDAYYANAFGQVLEHAGRLGPLAGCNIWAYAGEGRAAEGRIHWLPGDDYMGDPPQEEQGLNSVFDTDSTTGIISDFSLRLSSLTKN